MSFYTDVIVKSPHFSDNDRVSDLDLLEPATRQAVQTIVAQAKSIYGFDFLVFETYRSQNRQALLFSQGATKLKVVGVHHYGLACDLVKSINGQPSWKGDFGFLGKLAKANGLVWGGDWGHPQTPTNFPDSDHVQRCSIAIQHDLFAGSWYPDTTYDPYAG
jgi:hypothetical protein